MEWIAERKRRHDRGTDGQKTVKEMEEFRISTCFVTHLISIVINNDTCG